jgi:PST family polysaccharide transporter
MLDEQDKCQYKQSLKATSLFGGVQLYTIIIQIIKSKFIAVLLGSEGMGIAGMLASTTGLISALTNMGLGTVAVRDIAQANASKNPKRIALVVKVFRRLVWITGLLGAGICLIFAPFLSRITFETNEYALAFVVLSCTLLFGQLTSGQAALLQGMRKYSYMAKSMLWGSLIGLLVSVPLYYFWGFRGIVPVMMASSIASLIISWYYAQKIRTQEVRVSFEDFKKEGKGMLKVGGFLALQGLLPIIMGYLVRLYIARFGNLADVGLYNAGFIIIDTYVGMVFTAMAVDYYPQLSAFAAKIKEFNNLINQQIEVGLLVLSPLIVAFIVFIKLIITLLYSSKFHPIEGMVYWAIFAIFFKICSWAIAFTFLAKGDTKSFFFNELTAACYGFALNIISYYYWGLTGLGISYLVKFVLYFFQVWIFCSKKYRIELRTPIVRIFIKQFFIACGGIVLVLFAPTNVRYIVGAILLAASCFYSYKELDKRMDLSLWIKSKLNK